MLDNLEEAAKDNGKDSISLFSEDGTLSKFDDFINEIYKGNWRDIRRYFSGQKEQGINFLYQRLNFCNLMTKKCISHWIFWW